MGHIGDMGALFIDIDGMRDLAVELRGAGERLESLQREGLEQLAKAGDWHTGPFAVHLGEAKELLLAAAADLAIRADGFAEAERALSGSEPYRPALLGEFCAVPPSGEISSVAERLDGLLAEGGFWSFIGRGDRASPAEAAEATGILLALPAHQRQAVLEHVDEETLAGWLERLARYAPPSDLARLTDLLAETLPLPVLSRLLRAAPEDMAGLLLAGVAGGPPARALAVFQHWAADDDEDGWGPRWAVGLVGRMGFYGSPALRWLADTGRFDRFVAALLRTEKESITIGDMQPTTQIYRDHFTPAMRSLAYSLGEMRDPDLSARFFAVAMKILEAPLWQAAQVDNNFGLYMEINDFDDRPALMESLAALLLSAPENIFESLRLQHDIYGESTGIFFREAHRPADRKGRAADGSISEWGAGFANRILGAALGPGRDPQSRAEHFQARTRTAGGSYDYVNAARLGFIVGSVSRGLEDLQVTVSNQWQAVEIILGAAKVADPTATASLISLTATAAAPAIALIEAEQLAKMEAEQQSYERALVESVLPRENGRIYDGDAADEFFNTYNRVGGDVLPSGSPRPDLVGEEND